MFNNMLSPAKIFHFEMAHAIFSYQGACKNIHGNSDALNVSMSHGFILNDYRYLSRGLFWTLKN